MTHIHQHERLKAKHTFGQNATAQLFSL